VFLFLRIRWRLATFMPYEWQHRGMET